MTDPRYAGLTLLSVIMLGITAPADAQWIVSVYGGAAFTRPAAIRIEQPAQSTSLAFEHIPFDDRSFESPIYYGYRVMRAMPRAPALFVGGEFIHAKAYADGTRASAAGVHRGAAVQGIPFSAVVQRFAMSHGLNFVLANAGIRRAVCDRVTATATVGAGPVVPHAEVQIDGVLSEGYQVGGTGVQGAAGAELRVWRRVSLLAEYKWTRAAVRLTLNDGRLKLTASSHHLAAGLSAAF